MASRERLPAWCCAAPASQNVPLPPGLTLPWLRGAGIRARCLSAPPQSGRAEPAGEAAARGQRVTANRHCPTAATAAARPGRRRQRPRSGGASQAWDEGFGRGGGKE